jgi:hypothetical protein
MLYCMDDSQEINIKGAVILLYKYAFMYDSKKYKDTFDIIQKKITDKQNKYYAVLP